MYPKNLASQQFQIKLLSDNNVILVEAAGCEAEIFIPDIICGRITLQNIIPSRRCNQEQELPKRRQRYKNNENQPIFPPRPFTLKEKNNFNKNEEILKSSLAPKHFRSNYGREAFQYNKPIAFSTPCTKVQHTKLPNTEMGVNLFTNGLNTSLSKQIQPIKNLSLNPLSLSHSINLNSTLKSTNSPKITPEKLQPNSSILRNSVPSDTPPVIRDAGTVQRSLKKETLVQIPSGIRVVRICRDQSPNSSGRIDRIISFSASTAKEDECANNNIKQINVNKGGSTSKEITSPRKESTINKTKNSTELSSFNLPKSPLLNIDTRKSTSNTTGYACIPKPVKTSLPKWRKCVTPIKTYSRKRRIVGPTSLTSSFSSNNNNIKYCKYYDFESLNPIPTYLINPTQAPTISQVVQLKRIKKRKLIVDQKVQISPKSVKQQALKQKNLLKTIRNTNQLPRTRKLYELSKYSAFDLLTRSNYASVMSDKLNQLFRNGCVNKASSTIPKYKVLGRLNMSID